MDSEKYLTQHKIIYINIGKKWIKLNTKINKKKKIKKNKMCNKIKCTG